MDGPNCIPINNSAGRAEFAVGDPDSDEYRPDVEETCLASTIPSGIFAR